LITHNLLELNYSLVKYWATEN